MPANNTDIIQKLQERKRAGSGLPRLLEFYWELLLLQDDAGRKLKASGPMLTNEQINKRVHEGKSLLDETDLDLDLPGLRRLYHEIITLFSRYTDLFGEIPENITALTPGRVVNRRTLGAWYKGRRILLPVATDERAQSILKAVFSAVMQPVLKTEAAALIKRLDKESWRRGYCPICAGNPDFSYLERENGARWLVCPRCDAEWLFQRMECPYCGNTNQNKLSFFSTDDAFYRLYVCDACKHYLKAIDLRQTKESVLIPLERLSTLDLDRQAQEKGYTPCS